MSAHIGLSFDCNLKCKHCFVNKEEDNATNIKKLKDFIPELVEEGLFYLYYTYGEPLLCPDFFEFVKYIKKFPIYQILMSNGTLIDKEMAIKIDQSSIKKCMISVDSISPEKHDENRGEKGAWEKAINGIRNMRRFAPSVNVGIATTVTKENENELKELLDLAIKENVSDISFLAERKGEKILHHSLDSHYSEIYRNFVMFNDVQNINLFFHDLSLLKVTRQLFQEKKISEKNYEKFTHMNRCQCNTNISISPKGDVYVCNFMNGNLLGNIHKDSTAFILSKHKKCKNTCKVSNLPIKKKEVYS
ncbi:radical SAM protein [Paenibacillus sp. A3M_27_13]|uniref:radical SAM protein n=1 Tax=Paenibacillus sp. A3M_27_13 TaxID=2962029 RepID=UPI0020B8C4BE|nr:radical SAM protein [Paenibacillus sp. A3M_27_13]MCP3746814.1 radical SAM protein [Paenibacillus sp. A3M_27_13]